MRVMALGARNLAFGYRVVGKFTRIRSLIFMAGKADFGLGLFIAHIVMWRMDLVARGARQVGYLMRAALPVGAFLIFTVTGQASFILIIGFTGWQEAFTAAEYNIGRCANTVCYIACQMFFTFAVATLTGRGARIGLIAVRSLINGEYRLGFGFVMTACTDRVFSHTIGSGLLCAFAIGTRFRQIILNC